MRTIGVAGQLAYGKDVFADYLAERLNERSSKLWHRAAFAKAVKKVFMDTFNVDEAFIEKWKRIDEPPPGFKKNVRESLQFIGDGFRQIQGNIWIDLALRDDRDKIFADARYLNEAKAIRAIGGLSIVMYRPGFLNDIPNRSESEIRLVVEWCLKSNQKDGYIQFTDDCPDDVRLYDVFINNDGTIEELYQKVDDIVVPIIEEKFSDH